MGANTTQEDIQTFKDNFYKVYEEVRELLV